LLRKVVSVMLTVLLLLSMPAFFNMQLYVKADPLEIIIDTEVGESRFTTSPPRQSPYYWVHVQDHDTFRTRAYAGNFWYTLCGAEGTGEPLYFGTWYQSLSQSGVYEVFVWIPNPDPFEYGGRVYTPTQSAIYQIYHKYGMTTRTVNQRLRTGGWYSLGTYTFDTSLYVILNDRTGEPYLSTMIAFDAIKFVQVNNPPYTPSNPSPSNHATGVSIYADLSWSGGDPDAGDTVTYDVYFGVSSSPPLVSSGQSATTYDPGTLTYGTKYYWKIVAKDNHGASTIGPLWDFTTQSPQDFSISASPTSLIIQQGSSGSSTITIMSINGFNQLVQLSVSGAPSGVTATLSPSQVTPPAGGTATSTLTVSVATTATPGTYTLTVTGTSGALTHNTYVSLQITAVPPPPNQPPNPPALLNQYKTDGTEITVGGITVEDTVVFKGIVSDPDGDHVKLQVELRGIGEYGGEFNETAGGFKESGLVQNGNEAVAYAFGLNDGGYHWRARTVDEHGNASEWVDFGKNEIYWADFAVDTTPPETYIDWGPSGTIHDNDVTFKCSGWDTVTPFYYLRYSYYLEGYDSDWSDWTYSDQRSYTDLPNGDYTFKVKAKDDAGHVDPSPAERSFTVSLEKAISVMYAGMTVFYNQVGEANGEDIYAVSKISAWKVGLVLGIYEFSITRGDTTLWRDRWVLPGITTKDYVFESFEVRASDKINVRTRGVTFSVSTLGPSPNVDTASTAFDPDAPIETSSVWDPLTNWIGGKLFSPGELRVYDLQGRVTGLVNGEVKEEIPDSGYLNNTIMILSTSDSYRYEVAGTEDGFYGLVVTSAENEEVTNFTATDIPTLLNAIHQYTVDWDALSRGEEGVTVQVDSDGDGVFEHTFTSDSELTQSEFLAQMAFYTFSIIWGEETFIVSAESNSTVSNFAFNQPDKKISFNVTGEDGTIGFCNVTIPKALLYGEPWTVLIDGASVLPTITENATHCPLYFTYAHSTHLIQIIGTWVIAPPPPTYNLTIITTVGGTTDPAPGTYSYTANSSVQVTAIPNADYVFDHWELDTVNVGSANPYTVLMDNNHTLKAVFTYSPPPPPLSASISPLSASILVGQSVTFTSTVSGGYTPYTYQWYLNGNPVSGATSNTWAFTPTTTGIYHIYLKVTDAKGNTAQSDIARITAQTVPVGGYSIPIQLPATAKPATIHIALLTILTALFITIKRKTKRKH